MLNAGQSRGRLRYFKKGALTASLLLFISLPSFADPNPNSPYLVTRADPWIPNSAHPQFVKAPFFIVKTQNAGSVFNPANLDGPLGPDAVLHVLHDMTFDGSIEVAGVAVYPGARLRFAVNQNTQLKTRFIIVHQGAEMEVGTAASPVAAANTATILFTDYAENRTDPALAFYDPARYMGFLVFGKLTMHGAVKSPTWLRVAAEPAAGATAVQLDQAVSGWRAGDRLVFPDTRQIDLRQNMDGHQIEIRTVASISGNGKTVTLSQPLQYAHGGAHFEDGSVAILPHVGNLTRNVAVKSENKDGQRGHVMVMWRAKALLSYVEFDDLGRTTIQPLDNTTFDSNGVVTHLGTQQMGRYPVHFHHNPGPADGVAGEYQSEVAGCSVDGGGNDVKGSFVIHASHYILLKDNVSALCAGAHYVTEDGTETGVVFDRNLGIGAWRHILFSSYHSNGRTWVESTIFWANSTDPIFEGNAAYGGVEGYSIIAEGDWNSRRPLKPGDDPFEPGQHKLVNSMATKLTKFKDNMVASTLVGVSLWNVGHHSGPIAIGESLNENFVAWHIVDRVYYSYKTNKVTTDNLFAVNDFNILKNRQGGGSAIASGDYDQNNSLLRNSNIYGFSVGFNTSGNGINQRIENTYFNCYVGVAHTKRWTTSMPGRVLWNPQYRAVGQMDRSLDLNNVRFDPVVLPPRSEGIQPSNIAFLCQPPWGGPSDLTSMDQLVVRGYQGDSAKNYKIYCNPDSAEDFVVATSCITPWASGPVAGPINHPGLTNKELWEDFGMAVGGAYYPLSGTVDGASQQIIGRLRSFNPATEDVEAPYFPATQLVWVHKRGPNSVTLRWNEAKDNAGVAGYGMIWSTDEGFNYDWNYEPVVNAQLVQQGIWEATINNLDPDTEYSFYPTAFDNPGEDPRSFRRNRSYWSYVAKIKTTQSGESFAPIPVLSPRSQTVDWGDHAFLQLTITDPDTTSGHGVYWAVLEGPGSVNMNATSAGYEATFTNPGSYTIRVSVADGQLVGTDEVTVVVNSPFSVNDPPVIVDHPEDLVASIGQAATFVVAAQGTVPLDYQWLENGVEVPGATQSSLSFPAVTLAMNGKEYSCRVSNAFGTAVSNIAKLIVSEGPVNQNPLANAGPDLSVILPAAAQLKGNVLNAVSSAWSKVSGPATIAFGNVNSAQTTAMVQTPGVYRVRLTAFNGLFSNTDDALLTFANPGSVPPGSNPPAGRAPAPDGSRNVINPYVEDGVFACDEEGGGYKVMTLQGRTIVDGLSCVSGQVIWDVSEKTADGVYMVGKKGKGWKKAVVLKKKVK